MRRSVKWLSGSSSGAVAPTLALSLTMLIVAGGVAFDYARIASLDTEMQNAADQATLAAASQLDGKSGACARAAAVARNMLVNRTLMANDGQATPIIVADEPGCDATGLVRFYQNITKTTAATSDANARFVEIEVNPRQAYYTLTPVVGLLTTGSSTARAFAGVSSAICKVPPLMLCNPNEGSDPAFTTASYVGKGIRLVANDGGGGYGPGNFGFLDTNAGNGAAALRELLGRTSLGGDCAAENGVTTQPGEMISVLDALNTRFDVYANGLNQTCGADGSLCLPSANTRKDIMRGDGGGNGACAYQPGNGNVGWKEAEAPYLPASATVPLTDAEISPLSPMGYPRDMCHAVSNTGTCAGGRIGTGTWDRYAYFRSNSDPNYLEITDAATFAAKMTEWFNTTTPSRYQVYAWEMDRAAARLQPKTINNRTAHGAPVCAPSGVSPSPTTLDRRVISAAVINCTAQGINGRTTGVQVAKWIELFLVEPSLPRTRTEASDVYVEVIRETVNATDEGAVQEVKKTVPYLIE